MQIRNKPPQNKKVRDWLWFSAQGHLKVKTDPSKLIKTQVWLRFFTTYELLGGKS